jgi:6-pyruvoyltetrahydropterin/6-carboxytetrahydropterin synthase
MYELTINASFSSAHNLREYGGACERLHGHNWDVEVTIGAEKLDKLGMALDFKVLKAEAKKVLDGLDHKYLNELPPFDKLNPTAENLSEFMFKELSKTLNKGNVRVKKVKVWESTKAAAAYYE